MRIVVFQVRQLVSADRHDLVVFQARQQRVGEEDARTAHRREGDRVRDRSSAKSGLLEARHSRGAGLRECRELRDEVWIVDRRRAQQQADGVRVTRVPDHKKEAERERHEPAVGPGETGKRRQRGKQQPEAEDRDTRSRDERQIPGETPAFAVNDAAEPKACNGARKDEERQRPQQRVRHQHQQQRECDAETPTRAKPMGDEPLRECGIVGEGRQGSAPPPAERGRHECHDRGQRR